MPAKKKASRCGTKKTTRSAKKVYVCVPCGTEVTVTKKGMGVTRLMCCGEVMKLKRTTKKKKAKVC